jgi:hypothetical protein
MIATTAWEFRCMVHANKNGFDCCAVDFSRHNLEAFQNIITDPTYYPDRTDIKGKGVLSFPRMLKIIHRIIAYTFHHHKDIFNKYEEKYYLNEKK